MKTLSRMLTWLLQWVCRPVGKGFRQYIIPKGKHYCKQSRLSIAPIKDFIAFSVIFDASGIYTSSSIENQSDINKLWGFSEYLFSDHVDSARIGWYWNPSSSMIHLVPYAYSGGKVPMDPEGVAVVPGKEAVCTIQLGMREYIFTIQGKVFTQPRRAATRCIRGVQLFPYFGGQDKAPHEVRIEVKRIV